MAITKNKKKHIACLESLWDEELEDRLTVGPILDLMSKLRTRSADVKVIHLTCNTNEELKHNLGKLSGRKGYGILSLAFHGIPGGIWLDDESEIELETLALLMGRAFEGWVLHFGSCATLDIETQRMQQFISATGMAMVVGYTKEVDWSESAALDLLLFDWMQEYKDMRTLWKMFSGKYPDLIKHTGMVAFHPK